MSAIPDDRRELNDLLASFDAPAYVRRARAMNEALEYLLAPLPALSDEWLEMTRINLARLLALAGTFDAVAPLLADPADVAVLRRMHGRLQPRLRAPVEASPKRSVHLAALQSLAASVERFNGRWRRHLAKIDLSEVNRLREGYNRWYVLEKSCAVKNERVARAGFEPLPPIDLDELLRRFPLLEEVRVAGM